MFENSRGKIQSTSPASCSEKLLRFYAPCWGGIRKAAFLLFIPSSLPPHPSCPPSPWKDKPGGPEQVSLSQSLRKTLLRRHTQGQVTEGALGEEKVEDEGLLDKANRQHLFSSLWISYLCADWDTSKISPATGLYPFSFLTVNNVAKDFHRRKEWSWDPAPKKLSTWPRFSRETYQVQSIVWGLGVNGANTVFAHLEFRD